MSEHEAPTLDMASVKRPRIAGLLAAGSTALAILAVLFLVGFIPLRKRQGELLAESERAKTALPIVDAIHPRRSATTTDLTLPGTVRAFQETSIYARTNGYLKRWLVDIGDEVKSGQLLAEIEVPELDQELDAAKASLNQQKARVNVAKANVDLAQSTLKRYELAAPAGGITQQELAERRAGLEVANANVAAAQADESAGEANVRRLVELKSFADVSAPFSGTITARWVEVGTLVMAGNGRGQALYRMVQTNPARVFVSVPQGLAPSVSVGSKAELVVREHPGERFTGTVARTARSIDDTSKTLLAEIDIANERGLLLAGMYTQVRFSVSHEKPIVLIPEAALIVNANGTQVATVEGDRIKLKAVHVETDYGSTIGVSTGLGPEDLLVTNPSEKLGDGVQVTVRVREDREKPVH